MFGPDPNKAFPNEGIPGLCYIKNVVTNPQIIIGDYTYYHDPLDPTDFESHVTHLYPFLGDRLIIGKFCAIGKNVEFIMNGANHRLSSITTYPFNMMGGGWEKAAPAMEDLPFKGDTLIGNDVWIGQNVTVLPGIRIGDGAIIAANTTVTKSVPPYHIAGGNPSKLIRPRFNEAIIEKLLKIQWWNWDAETIFNNLDSLCATDEGMLRRFLEDL